jgi:hypothetical protein
MLTLYYFIASFSNCVGKVELAGTEIYVNHKILKNRKIENSIAVDQFQIQCTKHSMQKRDLKITTFRNTALELITNYGHDFLFVFRLFTMSCYLLCYLLYYLCSTNLLFYNKYIIFLWNFCEL